MRLLLLPLFLGLAYAQTSQPTSAPTSRPSGAGGEVEKPASAPASSEAKVKAPTPSTLDPHAQLLLDRDALKAHDGAAEALKIYEEAISLSDKARDLKRRAAQVSAEAERGPDPALIAPLPPPLETKLLEEMSVTDLEQRLRNLERDLLKDRERLARVKESMVTLREAPKALRVQLTERQAQLDGLKDKAPQLDEAPQRALTAARQRLYRAEIFYIEQQLLAQAPRLAATIAERDALATRVEALEGRLKARREDLERRRTAEARVAIEEAKTKQRQIARQAAPIRRFAEENVRLSVAMEAATRRLTELSEAEARLTRRLATLEAEADRALKRLNAGGLNEATSRLLRRRQRELPSARAAAKQAAHWRAEIAIAHSNQLDVMEREEEITPRADAAKRLLSAALQETRAPSSSMGMLSEFFEAQLEQVVQQLLDDRQGLLNKLGLTLEQELGALGRLDALEQRRLTRLNSYRGLLDERLLWIPSAPPVNGAVLKRAIVELEEVPLKLWRGARLGARGWLWSFAILVALLLGLTCEIYRWRIDEEVPQAPALRLVCASSSPIAVTLAGGGLSLEGGATGAVGAGLLAAGAVWLTIRTLRALVRLSDELAIIGEPLRREARRLEWLAVPAAGLIFALEAYGQPQDGRALQRLVLAATLLVLSVFMARVMRIKGGVSGPLITRAPDAWLTRLRFIWYPLAILTPLVLAALALIGYVDSALHLSARLLVTCWMLMGLGLLEVGLRRWLQRLAPPPSAPTLEPLDRSGKLKLKERTQLSEARLQVIRALVGSLGLIGLWLIWARVLPALNIFEEIQLWTYTSEVGGVKTQTPITLGRLVEGLLTFAFTLVAAKVIPSLFEMLFLLRLPINPGTRYAITQVGRYVIFAVGLILGLKALGLEWGRVQWLVAALSVGLGFGLQEIVANFVSGLILLVERPFRVGDMLTIGDVKGIVSKLQIRATTITAFDRRELVVPNKEFITGQLVNWSLSDPVARLTIPVGVAYGSDTQRAIALLLSIARAHPLVLTTPEPQAFFLSFGASSLDLELRVFVGDVFISLQVTHDLHTRIDAAFREANIEIAFPQQDTHLDVADPIPVQIVEPKG